MRTKAPLCLMEAVLIFLMRAADTTSIVHTGRESRPNLKMDQFDDNIDRLASAGYSRRRSSAACLPLYTPLPPSLGALGEVAGYRVLVLGPSKVGKTAIISQFLYDQFQPGYKPTVEEMYKVDLEVFNKKLSLNIEDTSGTFVSDFPAMAKC